MTEISRVSASEKSSLEDKLREMEVKVQTTEASRRQLEQQNRQIYNELIVYRQQQVTNDDRTGDIIGQVIVNDG